MTTRAIMDPLGYSSREQEVEDRNNNNNAGSVMQGVASYTSRTDAIQEVESPSSSSSLSSSSLMSDISASRILNRTSSSE